MVRENMTTAAADPSTQMITTCPTSSQMAVQFFTCTFCWHLSSARPRVIGRTARLVCEPCYAALIDLSVCWVCGEVVFRGDECVSLGWCFWHRACYGCLLCGSRLVVHGVTVNQLYVDRGGEDVKDGDDILVARGDAREVDQVPLCAHCYVEVEGASMDPQMVVDKALRRIDDVDGGLTRRRWEAGMREPSSMRNSKFGRRIEVHPKSESICCGSR